MIHAAMQRQGGLGIERLCELAGVSRAGYYRHWRASAPRQDETALRDVVQRLSLATRHHGHRMITALLRRDGWAVNHKRVERLRREDKLLCVAKKAPHWSRFTRSRWQRRVRHAASIRGSPCGRRD